MAEYSLFWGGTSVGDAANATMGAPYTDDMFSDALGALMHFDRNADGVVVSMDSRYSGMLGAVVDHENATISILPGIAMVDGKLYLNTSTQNFVMTSNGTWQVVLRKDFNAQTVRMVWRLGSSVTQTDGSIWEIELWRFDHLAGSISYTNAGDRRKFLPMSSGKYRIRTIERQNDVQTTETQFIFNVNANWPFKTLRLEWENTEYTYAGELSAAYIMLRINGHDADDYYQYYLSRDPTEEAIGWELWEYSTFGLIGTTGVNGAKGYGWAEFPNWNTLDNQKVWLTEGFTLGALNDTLALGGGVTKVFGGVDYSNPITQIAILAYSAVDGLDAWNTGSRISLYGII